MTRVAIYARVSTDDAAREGTSLPDQEKKLRLWADSLGFEVVEVYRDDGISGAVPLRDRPAGARLYVDASMGKFQKVLCTNVDRFSRSLIAGATDLKALTNPPDARNEDERGLGVGVSFQQIGNGMDDSLDTSGGMGKMMLQILLMFAEWERDTIRARTSAGNVASARQGKILPGRLPYGITSDDDGQLLIDESEAPAVRTVFLMRSQGRSLVDIVRWLNESQYEQRKVFSKEKTALARKVDPDAPEVFTDGTWRKGVVANMLSQPAYVGTYAKTFSGELFTFDVKPIIDKGTWDKVQNMPMAPIRKRQGVKKRLYALSGRIFHDHGEDATKMFGRTMKGTRIYRCYSAQGSDGTKSTCPGLGVVSGGKPTTKVDASRIEALALLWMLDSLQDPTKWADYIAHADETLLKEGAAPDDLEAYQEAVAELEDQLAYIDTRAITLAGERGPEAAAEWAEEMAKPIKANLKQAKQALERIQSAQTWRKGLEGGLEALLAMEIKWTPEGQKEADEIAEEHFDNLRPGDDQWLDLLRQAARTELQPDARKRAWEQKNGAPWQGLSRWAREWIRHMAHHLNLTVTLTERTTNDGLPEAWKDEPLARFPEVHVSFAPQAGLQKGSVSWAVMDLNQ